MPDQEIRKDRWTIWLCPSNGEEGMFEVCRVSRLEAEKKRTDYWHDLLTRMEDKAREKAADAEKRAVAAEKALKAVADLPAPMAPLPMLARPATPFAVCSPPTTTTRRTRMPESVQEGREWPVLNTWRYSDGTNIFVLAPGHKGIEPSSAVEVQTYVPESASNVLSVEEARLILDRIADRLRTDRTKRRPRTTTGRLGRGGLQVTDYLQEATERCRNWFEDGDHGGHHCNKPAEFIVWGKLFDKDALGPRCYDCAAAQIGHNPLRANDHISYAVYRLPNVAALEVHYREKLEGEFRRYAQAIEKLDPEGDDEVASMFAVKAQGIRDAVRVLHAEATRG